jgi:hypothetical protein
MVTILAKALQDGDTLEELVLNLCYRMLTLNGIAELDLLYNSSFGKAQPQ